MPVLPDFATTHQWLRELRTHHGERMIVVYVCVPDDAEVHAGLFGREHVAMRASESAAWVTRNPAGAEVILPFSIARRDVLSIRETTQLVGWVGTPSGTGDCVCIACLPRGDRRFMRRVRSAYANALRRAASASEPDEQARALGGCELPLERAPDRLELEPLIPLTRSAHAVVRQQVARLLGLARSTKASAYLDSLSRDPDEEVRRTALAQLVLRAGLEAILPRVAGESAVVVDAVLDELEYGSSEVQERARRSLEALLTHEDEPVRALARRAAERVG
jgi:hypothetical protein